MSTFIPTAPLQTAVLLVIFNRPETTRQVFEAIRKAKPPRLYIAADGPRDNVKGEAAKCEETRAIVEHVDWACEVKTLYQPKNLNCGVGPSTAFTWFFEHEEEGIILEDDCLPSQSFFWYCEDLLRHYREDYRIMHIGGNNFLQGWKNDPDYSYYFSRSGHIWGWATWRRAWKMFDYNIELYDKVKAQNYFDKYFLNALEKIYRLRKFDQTITSTRVDWWDYQWDFARFANAGLAIVPSTNLVRNIGFGQDSTHTQNEKSKSANLEAHDMDSPLRHPPFMIRDIASDKQYFKNLMKDVLLSKLA